MVALCIAAVLAAHSFAPAPQASTEKFFYAGGDPSEIPEVEASGVTYKLHGKKIDPLVAMKEAGWTAVRLRIWNDPKAHNNWCDLPHTLAMARRAHDAGLRVMIDFHYSDWWADPQQQHKPAAWKNLNPPELAKALHDYSRDVIKALVDQGTPASVVQPGNEITNGMLWPDGKVEINDDGWDQIMPLLKAAIAGIREGGGATKPRIMIHLDQGGRNAVCRLWLDNYFEHGGDLDIIGLSYYPQWHGTMKQLTDNLADLSSRYHKDLMVAETAFPYNANVQFQGLNGGSPVPDIPASPEGQLTFLRRLTAIVRGTPGRRGIGVLWWAPAWVPPPAYARSWRRGTTLFDRDGEALPALYAFKEKG